MYSYLFEEFTIENQNVDFKNPHLWILNSDKIPPHIGISQDFKFFSLKASGKDNGLTTSDIFSLLKKKNIEFILVEFNSSVIEKEIAEVFSDYSKAIPFETSCIAPILECFNIDKPFLLFDLLEYFNLNRLINLVNVYNFQREKLGLGIYGEEDVAREIVKLQSVKRK
jgi:hypothetical protein